MAIAKTNTQRGEGKPRCTKAYPQKAINLLNVVVHPENRDKEPQEMFTFLELFECLYNEGACKKYCAEKGARFTLFTQLASATVPQR